ncbi:MAG TPA: hypothetical protein VFE53_19140, partial [Mucilaginibacter sp.]|nr:hypothetical protein [Mucilaginibacter sp.]
MKITKRRQFLSEPITKSILSGRRGGCFVPRNDMWVNGVLIALLFVFSGSSSFAQTPYDNLVYRPEIKSVEFYNTKKQA